MSTDVKSPKKEKTSPTARPTRTAMSRTRTTPRTRRSKNRTTIQVNGRALSTRNLSRLPLPTAEGEVFRSRASGLATTLLRCLSPGMIRRGKGPRWTASRVVYRSAPVSEQNSDFSLPRTKTESFMLHPVPAARPGRVLTVREVGALSDSEDITDTITDVAARLAVLGDRLRDELGSSTFP